jgi:hypothetical protein
LRFEHRGPVVRRAGQRLQHSARGTLPSFRAEQSPYAVIPREAKRSRGIHPRRLGLTRRRGETESPSFHAKLSPVIPREAKRSRGIHPRRLGLTRRRGERGETASPSFHARHTPVIPRGAKRSRGIHPAPPATFHARHTPVIPRGAKPIRRHSARSEAQSRNPSSPSRNIPREAHSRHSARSEAQSRNPSQTAWAHAETPRARRNRVTVIPREAQSRHSARSKAHRGIHSARRRRPVFRTRHGPGRNGGAWQSLLPSVGLSPP